MPTKVTFDNPTLADAVNKASRIAPTKGAAYDKASGIVFVVNTAQQMISVRATNLECSFMQDIPCMSASGDDTSWRIPSAVLGGIVGQLEMGEGKVTEFIDRGDKSIRLKSDKLVVKLALLDASQFPQVFEYFDSDGMTPANALAHRVEQVSWSTDPKSTAMAGVRIDGKRLLGCNQYTIAAVGCEIALQNPITVPLSSLAQVLKTGSDVRCRAVDRVLQILLDDNTRATTTLINAPYPPLDKAMRTNFTGVIQVHRQSFVDKLSRMMVLIRQERIPKVHLEINGSTLIKMITFDMEVPDLGRIQDSLDFVSDYEDVHKIAFAPRMLLDGASNAKGDILSISFGHPEKALAAIRLTDTHGYCCYVSPKKDD